MITLTDYLLKYDMLPEKASVLCAVSGGADSMCLLCLMLEARATLGVSVSCAHFNHRLRGAESDGDEAFVRDFCAARGVPFYCGAADVKDVASERGLGVEEAARLLRYEFLESAADESGASRIATAHTADDNAETVLLNLARGAGLRGLAGIPPVRGRIIRPMLGMTRADVEAYLEENGIPHVEDSSNAADDYSRNRLRHHVIPVIRGINPSFSRTVRRQSALLREDADLLDSLARSFIAENRSGESLRCAALLDAPRPVSSRALRAMSGASLEPRHIDALLELCAKGAGFTDIPGMRVAAEGGCLVFGAAEPESFEPFTLDAGQTALIPAAGLEISADICAAVPEIHSSLNTFFFKCENICGNILVRPRNPGDEIRILGRNCTKSLRKLFIEAGTPVSRRGLVPVLADDRGPLAVYGFGVSERAAAGRGDVSLRVEIKKASEE